MSLDRTICKVLRSKYFVVQEHDSDDGFCFVKQIFMQNLIVIVYIVNSNVTIVIL